jgi:predicted PurR-regulated permease PerM
VEARKEGRRGPFRYRRCPRRRVEITGRIIWQTIGAVLVTLVALWAINQARSLVSMLAIAFFFGLALEPGVRALVARYEWRRGSATGVIFVVGFAFVVLMVLVLIPSLAQLAQLISERSGEWIADLNVWFSEQLGLVVANTESAAELVDETGTKIADFVAGAFGTVLGIATTGISLVFNLATIAMFTFYFTAEAPKTKTAVLRLFSPDAQQRIGWTWDQAITQTGGYFYSRMILMCINGLGFFFTMVLVGLPVEISLALALFGSFVSVFIPVIGTYLGGAVPILLTLALDGLTGALILLGYVLVYQQVENYWLSPKLSSKTMTLNGGVAFGAALAGGAIAGPMGAFTALPIAALITSFLSNYVASHEVVYQSAEPTPSDSGRRRRRRSDEATDAEVELNPSSG